MKLKKIKSGLKKLIKKTENKDVEEHLIIALNEIKSAEKLLVKINEGVLTVSDIAELIRNTPLIDINNNKCFATVNSEENAIEIYYEDPGDWEESEYNENEFVLTQESILVIEKFLKTLCPQIKKIEIDHYHLADVKFIAYL